MSLSKPKQYSAALAASAKDDLEKGAATDMDSAYTYTGVKNKLNSMMSLIQKGEVRENLVSEYLSGFQTPHFQGLITKTTNQKIFAGSQYTGQTELTFEIVPPNGTYYNPSTIQLYLTLQFTNNDKSGAMPNNVVAVNNFISRLIKDINIVKNRTEENITPQQSLTVSEYCDFQLDNFDTDHYYLASQILHSSRSKVNIERRANVAGTGQAGIDARTDANLSYRIANYRNTQNSNSPYIINLSLLDSCFGLNDMIKLTITVRFGLESDMKKLFETNKVGGINDNLANFKITTQPFLNVEFITASPTYENACNKIFNSSKVYNFNLKKNYTKKNIYIYYVNW